LSYELHFLLLDEEGRIECYLYECKTANRSVAKMFVLLSNLSNILDLTVEHLQYIIMFTIYRTSFRSI